MDPILEAATTKLFAKLEALRAKGTSVDNDQIEQWLRAETQGKFGLADAQGLVRQMGEGSFANAGRALRHGASMGWDDEAIGAIEGGDAGSTARLRDKAYSAEHPWLAGGLKTLGGIAAPFLASLAAPEVLGAGGVGAAGGRMLAAGAAAGATAGAGEADPGSRLEGAVKGGAAGLLAGPAVGLAAKGAAALGRGVRNMAIPGEQRAVKQAGRMMPDGLGQQAARQEMLAPGSFLPAGASPEAAQHVAAGVGANPSAAMAAAGRVRRALKTVTDAREDVGTAYDDVGKAVGPMPVDNDLRDILHLVGEDNLGMGQTVGFPALHDVRTKYAEKLGKATTAKQKETFGKFKERLNEWLTARISYLPEIDSRYAFLSRTKENYEKLLETVERSNMAHGKNELYGAETGSIGGTLTTGGARGLAQRAMAALTPGKAMRAGDVANTLVAPADATMAARLEASRRAAAVPPPPQPMSEFGLPAAGGNAIMELLAQLQQPLPSQMQGQQ